MPVCAAVAANLPVAKGQIIGGKYRVEEVLGIGGTAVVVSATHLQLQQKFAVKLVLPSMVKQGPEHLERLLREARVVAQMKSPHVSRVVDVGALDDGAPFMVMELLEGIDLEGHLQLRGKLPVAEAVDYVLQICEAVAEAHSLGVVHRDLKPGNVFITHDVDRRPLAKVLDFGLSKISVRGTQGEHKITQPLDIMGTPAYMSPEQLRATRDVDERSDIWSLGVILYELLTGRVPFNDASIQELCAMIIRDAPAPIDVPLPQGLETVITRCLQKDPAHRFPKVSALAIALAPFAEQKQRLERVLRVQPLGAAAFTVAEAEAPPPTSRPVTAGAPTQAAIVTDTELAPAFGARRGWGLFAFGIAGAIAGVAILAGVGLYATKYAPEPAAPAPTAEPAPAAPPAESSAAPAPPAAETAGAAPTDPSPPSSASATAIKKPATKHPRTPSGARPTTTATSGTTAATAAPKAPTDPDKLLETR